MDLLTIARNFKSGKLSLEQIPRGVRRRVTAIAADPDVDLESYAPRAKPSAPKNSFVANRIRNVRSA